MDAKVVTAPTELLPCPFCGGGRARTIHIRDGRKVACICGACGKPEFHGPLDRPDAESRAITAWNTRAVSAAEGDLLGRCLEALRMAAPLLAEAREALCGRDDVCTTSDGDDALLPLRDAINFILSQAREVK